MKKLTPRTASYQRAFFIALLTIIMLPLLYAFAYYGALNEDGFAVLWYCGIGTYTFFFPIAYGIFYFMVKNQMKWEASQP